MDAIGGYFGLELPISSDGAHFHGGALKLNTARCAFEYMLRARGYGKVYLPYYTCDVMVEPIERLGLQYEFYSIDKELFPILERKIADGEVMVYTNYYGVCGVKVEEVISRYGSVVVDNSQAFFAPPIDGIDTFYSARKFVGTADGAYLYTTARLDTELPQDSSWGRMSHLLRRIDQCAEVGYADFQRNDASLTGESIKLMSKLTEKILQDINYKAIAERRRANFASLHQALGSTNSFPVDLSKIADEVPMAYPYLVENGSQLRRKLIESRIFVARYWPNVEQWCTTGSFESYLTQNLLPLPIDQRYTLTDMQKIIKLIYDGI